MSRTGYMGVSGRRWREDTEDFEEGSGDRAVILLSTGHTISGEVTYVFEDEGHLEIDGHTDVRFDHIVAIHRPADAEPRESRGVFVRTDPKM